MDLLDVELWRVPTPIPHPVLTAAGRYDTYSHLVVVVHGPEVSGWGYSGMATPAQLDGACAFARSLVPSRRARLDQLLAVEAKGVDTASRGATSAIALAAWDYASRRLGVAPADLWGRRNDAPAIDAYASGFFLDATLDELRAEAARYRDAGFTLVKMRTGLSLDEDVARYRAIKELFPAPRAIAADAFHSWSADAARAFVDAVDGDLMWVEDATPYGEMAALHPSNAPIASGESLETTDEVLALVRDASLDHALLDVQRLGGPRNWLRCADAVAHRAPGTRIGGHVYTPHSLHLLACVADPLPVEVFDWSDPLFAAPPVVDAHGRLSLAGPGFGVELAPDVLTRHGSPV